MLSVGHRYGSRSRLSRRDCFVPSFKLQSILAAEGQWDKQAVPRVRASLWSYCLSFMCCVEAEDAARHAFCTGTGSCTHRKHHHCQTWVRLCKHASLPAGSVKLSPRPIPNCPLTVAFWNSTWKIYSAPPLVRFDCHLVAEQNDIFF